MKPELSVPSERKGQRGLSLDGFLLLPSHSAPHCTTTMRPAEFGPRLKLNNNIPPPHAYRGFKQTTPLPPPCLLRHRRRTLAARGLSPPPPCRGHRYKQVAIGRSQPNGKGQSASQAQRAWPLWGLTEAGSQCECVLRTGEQGG